MMPRSIFCCLMAASGLAWMLALAPAPAAAQEAHDYDTMRARMVAIVRQHASLVNAELGLDPPGERIMAAMGRVERHAFVPEAFAPLAYLDTPLPVGHDQNIAQPFIIALMTELAAIRPGDRVFETGTGAGYHAALLSELGAHVYSVEIVPELAERAAATLVRLGYDDVEIRIADGYDGWPEAGPYDAMLIKESVVAVPPALIAQLKPGGRMVAPIGPADGRQFLTVLEKDADGRITRRKVLAVRFSPFQGGQRT
jgi:protein-L-isoaspartate(D-aspartate) O-methyltransferase